MPCATYVTPCALRRQASAVFECHADVTFSLYAMPLLMPRCCCFYCCRYAMMMPFFARHVAHAAAFFAAADFHAAMTAPCRRCYFFFAADYFHYCFFSAFFAFFRHDAMLAPPFDADYAYYAAVTRVIATPLPSHTGVSLCCRLPPPRMPPRCCFRASRRHDYAAATPDIAACRSISLLMPFYFDALIRIAIGIEIRRFERTTLMSPIRQRHHDHTTSLF